MPDEPRRSGDLAIGRRIALARAPRSQYEFVALLEVERPVSRARPYNRDWLATIETGARAISVADLQHVCRVLRLPWSTLLGPEPSDGA